MVHESQSATESAPLEVGVSLVEVKEGEWSGPSVELLARHLVRDDASIDEHQAIALAASMTVRQLRAELADHPNEAGDHAARRVRPSSSRTLATSSAARAAM